MLDIAYLSQAKQEYNAKLAELRPWKKQNIYTEVKAEEVYHYAGLWNTKPLTVSQVLRHVYVQDAFRNIKTEEQTPKRVRDRDL